MSSYLINLTPHTVHLYTSLSGADPVAIPSSGIARCAEICIAVPPIRWDFHGDQGMHEDVLLVRKSYGDVTGLPAPRQGALYIVSALVQAACPSRLDLVVPHDVVRDAGGAVLGCRGFSRLG